MFVQSKLLLRCNAWRNALPNIAQQTQTRSIRTVRRADPPVNIDAQLAAYPGEIRKQILDEMRHSKTSGKAGEVTSDDFSASVISDFLDSAQSPETLDAQFWKSVEMLAKAAMKAKSPNHVDLFVRLFESAKDVENADLRYKLMSDIGRYIYRLKTVRFDQVNEIEFLDSLVANGRAFQALKLWSTRRSHEDHQTLWQEVGILYHLDAGLVSEAARLARAARANHPQALTPRVVTSLINAWAHQLRRGRSPAEARQQLRDWTEAYFELGFSPSHLETIFHALLSSRSWEMSARVAQALPTALVEEIEADGRLLLLAGAFKLSATSKLHSEENFMPLFEILLEKFPALASHESVSASLIISFIRQGDTQAALGLLEDFSALGTRYSPATARELARSFIRGAGADDNVTAKAEQLLQSPEATITVLEHLKRKGTAAEFVKKYVRDGRNLTPKLSFDILRTRAFKLLDSQDVLKLGIDENTWRYIWYLSARDIIKHRPEELAAAMSGHEVSPELLLFMCKSFIRHADSFESGAASLFASLTKFEPATPAQGAMLLGTLNSSRFHNAIPMSPSNFKANCTEDVPLESRIPWIKITEQAQKHLGMPNLMPTHA